jgi:hypothetical protein
VPILFSSDGNKWLFLFLRVAAISVGIGLLNWLTLNYLTYDLLALAVSVALMLLSYVMIGLTLPRSDRVELQMLLSTAIAGLRNLRA